ncbi:MAG: RecX family transcriptional regulator [Saprospiraceae bacterium]|nr:RecX family transcriptional regulator [Saprospiraceae bacterium]
MKANPLNPDTLLSKIRKYCDYQERCHQEVRYQMLKLGARGEILEKIIGQLVEEGFLDEERFALAFARGKFRNNLWGKQRIRLELGRRKIGTYLQNKALEEIDPDEYRKSLSNLLMKKKQNLSPSPDATQKQKLFKYAHQRGFEADLIYELIQTL